MPEDGCLESVAELLDLAILLPVMHDFLSKQIEDCDPEAEMKEYLTYASAIDLEELEWFEHLPDTLQVRQALATYTYLASIN